MCAARTLFISVTGTTSFPAGSRRRRADAAATGEERLAVICACPSLLDDWRHVPYWRCAGTFDNGLQRHLDSFSAAHALG